MNPRKACVLRDTLFVVGFIIMLAVLFFISAQLLAAVRAPVITKMRNKTTKHHYGAYHN